MDATYTPKTLLQAARYYADLNVCQKLLVEARWPDGVSCPSCGRTDVSYLETQKRWQCKTKHAKRQFSVKVGTIFEDSPIGLDKWFTAMWLIAGAKNGISSYELHRAIGVTQKTAWFLNHRIRLAMQTGSFNKLGGTVEVDETFIGGKARNMHRSKHKRVLQGKHGTVGKVAVMGLLERHGKDGHSTIRTAIVPKTKRHPLHGEIRKHVDAGATVNTDALRSYRELDDEYIHNVIDHAEAYVNGQVHTNGCENFWSLLKRSIRGTYVSVEPFHLFRYLDEQAYRFNNRHDNDAGRFAGVLASVTGRRLMYKDLIGEQPA
jgi:transposase-like protein